MKTVTLPVYKRADYLRETLDALKSNRTDGYTLYVSVEPGSDEVAGMVKAIDFMPTKILWNKEKLGLNANIRQALFSAMEDGSEFNVAIEDDVVLSPDALDLAEWFRTYDKRGEYIALVLCHFDGKGRPRVLHPLRKFWSWGYCFTREGWKKAFVDGWDYVEKQRKEDKRGTNWDTLMMRWVLTRRFSTLLPDLSRSRHIGEVGGTHFLEHNASKHYDRFFRNLPVSDGSVRDGFVVEGTINECPTEEYERRILGRWR